MSAPEPEKLVHVAAMVPVSVVEAMRSEVRRLRTEAPDLRGLTMSNIVRLALREYVERHAPANTEKAQAEVARSIRQRGAIPAKTRDAILKARAEGLSIRETAKVAGVSIGKAHGVIKAETETADAAN